MPEAENNLETIAPRAGVVICECGGQVSRAVDVEELTWRASQLPGVVYAIHEAYPCSRDGQERLRRAVAERGLERVLVAGCAPRLVDKLFKNTLLPAGIDPAYFSVVNIREQAGWMHAGDPQGALLKAAGAIEMGVAHLLTTRPAPPHLGEVVRSALVASEAGGGPGGMTVALSLAERGVAVTLIEAGDEIGVPTPCSAESLRALANKRRAEVLNHPNIKVMLHTHLVAVHGHPGKYEVWVQQRSETTSFTAGVIIVSNISRFKELDSRGGSETRWFDRKRVKSQVEFEEELEQLKNAGTRPAWQNVAMILCAEVSQLDHCSRVCCNSGIRQAIQVKQLNPDATVTVLFRELYLGREGEANLIEARRLGVTFFRYQREAPPVIGDMSAGQQAVELQDLLTSVPVQVPYDRLVMSMPLIPLENSSNLAALLDLAQDEYGFLAEPRMRLRPGRYVDPGIYVLGSANLPADTSEALFQAYLTSARALRLLNQENIRVEIPVAEIDASLCTGCGNCPQVCPVEAIHLEKRDGILSLSEVDSLRCTGCGNCAVVCPVKAISLPGWDNAVIPYQISAALDDYNFKPGESKVLVLACEWSAYAAGEEAGHRHRSCPANARILRMNCSARFDPYHILWSFLNGADGVLLGVCPPGECHYGMGNLYARERVEVLQKELAQHGIDPRRLKLVDFTVDEGEKFAQETSQFVEELKTNTMDQFQRR